MYNDSAAKPSPGNRKVSKSVMEKKRRARINTSVSELKSMLSGLLKLQGERFDKLEKADILEMTVKYIKQFQCQPLQDKVQAKPATNTYEDGFSACVTQVDKYVDDTELKTRILSHLADRVTPPDTSQRHLGRYRRQDSEVDEEVPESASCNSVLTSRPQRNPSPVNIQPTTTAPSDCNNNSTLDTTHPFTPPTATEITAQGCDCKSVTTETSVSHGQFSRLESVQYVSCLLPNGQISILIPAKVVHQQVPVKTSLLSVSASPDLRTLSSISQTTSATPEQCYPKTVQIHDLYSSLQPGAGPRTTDLSPTKNCKRGCRNDDEMVGPVQNPEYIDFSCISSHVFNHCSEQFWRPWNATV